MSNLAAASPLFVLAAIRLGLLVQGALTVLGGAMWATFFFWLARNNACLERVYASNTRTRAKFRLRPENQQGFLRGVKVAAYFSVLLGAAVVAIGLWIVLSKSF